MADDFDMAALADYLHLDIAKVTRLAERGKLPGRRVGGDWRFSQAEIHHWLEERIGDSNAGELLRLEAALERAAGGTESILTLAEMLPAEAVALPLAARTRASVMTSMVELAAETGWLWDPEKMATAVRQREELHPTTVDGGVALLHPRRPLSNILAQPFLALGITGQGIPFGDERGRLTDVFFLICSIDDGGHLRTLARLGRLMAEEGFLDELRSAPDGVAARALIVEREQALG